MERAAAVRRADTGIRRVDPSGQAGFRRFEMDVERRVKDACFAFFSDLKKRILRCDPS
jgi:hypothetical protein